MKITEQTQSRMVVQSSALGQALFGALFVVIGIVVFVALLKRGLNPGLLVGAVFAVVGGFMMVSARQTTITIDKGSATLSIVSRSVLNTKDQSVNIADIEKISYQESVYSEQTSSGFQTRRDDSSIIMLKDGNALLLGREQRSTGGSSFGMSFSKSKDRAVDKAVAAFLGVPMVEQDAPTFAQALGQIRQTIMTARQEPGSLLPSQPPPTADPPQAPAPSAPPVSGQPAPSEDVDSQSS